MRTDILQLIGQNWLSFIILVILLGALFYAARKIKKEKDLTYEHFHHHKISFFDFEFILPTWWTIFEEKNNQEIYFIRTDSHYDWKFTLSIIDLPIAFANDDNPATRFLLQKIEELNLQFDEPTSVIQTQTNKLRNFSLDLVNTKREMHPSKNYEILRIEGTCTENGTERLYIDTFVISRFSDKQQLLWGFSKSSILNGCVEGPYVDETFRRIRDLA